MAKIVTLRCDGPCGQTSTDDETIRTRALSFDGKNVEVDLCDADAKIVSEIVALGSEIKTTESKSKTRQAPKHDATAVKAWAVASKATVSGELYVPKKQGRIPTEIITKYEAAHS